MADPDLTDDADPGTDEEAYRTVGGRGRVAFEIRGSEFVGHASPARTIDEAETFVSEIEAAYDDATHNVPAYRVREGDILRAWSSDAGEPTGSAGKPALNVLEQRDLENVVVVVTRYFGGTELGVGGLARAYARGAKEAVDDAGVIEERPRETLALATDYDDSGTVRGVLESAGVAFEADYGERVSFDVVVPTDEAEALRDRLRSATGGRVEIE